MLIKPGELWRDSQGVEVEVFCVSLAAWGNGALVTYCQNGELWTRKVADFVDPSDGYIKVSQADGTAV